MYGPGDVRFFDRIARFYDRVVPPVRAPLAAGLALADRPVERVVDVGGGTGRSTRALDVSERIVFDASDGMLDRARTHGLDCVRGDARRLPLRDASVDAVTLVDALHHLPNPATIVDEIVRVLAPGGVLVVADFDPETLRGRALVLGERLVGFDSTFTAPSDFARFLSERGLESRVVDDGFGYVVAGRKPRSA